MTRGQKLFIGMYIALVLLLGIVPAFNDRAAGSSIAQGSVSSITASCGLGGGIITRTGTLVTLGVCTVLPNALTPGTILNSLAKLIGSVSEAVVTATTDTSGAVGIAFSGAGTAGNVTLIFNGQVPCNFDGATIAGDYVILSPLVAGDCADSGLAPPAIPATGQIIGRVASTNAVAGLYTVEMSVQRIQ